MIIGTEISHIEWNGVDTRIAMIYTTPMINVLLGCAN